MSFPAIEKGAALHPNTIPAAVSTGMVDSEHSSHIAIPTLFSATDRKAERRRQKGVPYGVEAVTVRLSS
jgi:hypothetical protein